MTVAAHKRTHWAIWVGLLLTLLGFAGNALSLLRLSTIEFTWLVAAFAVLGALFLLLGVLPAFRNPREYRGKLWGSIVFALSLLLCAGEVTFFVFTRHLPRSSGAPQLGQRLPDFTLPDSSGQPVSLSRLLAGAPGAPPPRGVLLVFYRGYW
ncbi:MAG TPA: hypothetical protein VLW54_06685 [Candidatus Acidoferrales bacterium]|nr:hypothetical protein [Candidatus Acidoferrales bacterium]